VAAIALGPADHVVAVGQTLSPRGIDFGGGRIGAGTITQNAFVVELEPTSGHVCSRSYGGPATGAGVAIDVPGNVYVTGGFSGQLDIGLGPMSSSAGLDIFVGAFGP
jgi:hypothetical protein